jgi:hypothetical protein
LRDSGSVESTSFKEIDLTNPATVVTWSWLGEENEELTGLNSWPLTLESNITNGSAITVNSITNFHFTSDNKAKKL